MLMGVTSIVASSHGTNVLILLSMSMNLCWKVLGARDRSKGTAEKSEVGVNEF